MPNTKLPNDTTGSDKVGPNQVQTVDLPKEIRLADWTDLAQWGINRVGQANKYKYRVEIPEGWHVRPSRHPHWQELVDPQGYVRADIYFCQDFRATRSFLSLRRRYTTSVQCSQDNTSVRMLIMDGAREIFATDWIAFGNDGDHARQFFEWRAHQEAERRAKEWLKENLPHWQSCLHSWI